MNKLGRVVEEQVNKQIQREASLCHLLSRGIRAGRSLSRRITRAVNRRDLHGSVDKIGGGKHGACCPAPRPSIIGSA